MVDAPTLILGDFLAAVILVDEVGVAYLVISPPSTFCVNWRRAHDDHSAKSRHGHSSPSRPDKKMTIVVSDLKRAGSHEDNPSSTETSKRQKLEANQAKDQEIVETAILERKSQLEKGAEQRAEVVFKQWNKEKKTLEQAIDESFRYLLLFNFKITL